MRYLQGALSKGPQLRLPDDLSKQFFASISESVTSLLRHLPGHQHEKTAAQPWSPCSEKRPYQRTLPISMNKHLSSRNPVFSDEQSLLLCSAIVRYCTSGTVFRSLLPPADGYYSDPLAESIASLGPAFWLFVAACHAGDIDLAQQILPQALETTDGRTLGLEDPALVRCLFVAIDEDQADVFQFLLSIGIDPNIKCGPWQSQLVLAHVVDSGRPDLLSILLSSPHRLSELQGPDGEVVYHAANLEDAIARHTMVDGLLTNGLCRDEASGRHEVLSNAFWYSDLLLAEKMLVDDPTAAIYSIPIAAVVEKLGRGRESNIKLIRLFIKHSHKFATTPMEHLPQLQSAEAQAIAETNDLADFVELLGFLTHVPPVKRFLAACQIEGAIEEVEKRDGILDLNAPTTRDECMPFEVDNSSASFVLGAQALKRAIFYGHIANVEILLDRGVTADDEIQVMTDWTTTEPEKFLVLQKLLSDERSPRVAVCDRTYPDPRLLWRRGQGLTSITNPT